MKFRNKCWVLYLGQDKDWTQVQIGKEVVGEQRCREGCGVQAAQCESAVSSVSLAGKQHPRMHQTQHCQCKRGDYCCFQHWCSLFWSAECSSGPCDLKIIESEKKDVTVLECA